MNNWQIDYWAGGRTKSPIEKWLDALPKDQFKSVAKELIMLKKQGNELRLPHSKSLGKGLFELRERKYGYRLYYCFYRRYGILLLAAGDKKSQEKDIRVARERLEDINKG